MDCFLDSVEISKGIEIDKTKKAQEAKKKIFYGIFLRKRRKTALTHKNKKIQKKIHGHSTSAKWTDEVSGDISKTS
jgi:hypothetical protein